MSYGNMDVETNSSYLKIEKGKPVTVNILTPSERVEKRYTHYTGQKYEQCPGEECNLCEEGIRKETKYKVSVFDRADQKLKKFEFGTNIALGIKEIAKVLEEDGQTIHQVDLYISRISENPVRYQVIQRKMAGAIPKEILDDEVPF